MKIALFNHCVKIERMLSSYQKRKLYSQIVDRDGNLCRGCGRHDRLSLSHLVPVSANKKLENDPENIHLHCMTWENEKGCHNKHEDKQWDDMLDGEEILLKLEQLDPEYFKLVTL